MHAVLTKTRGGKESIRTIWLRNKATTTTQQMETVFIFEQIPLTPPKPKTNAKFPIPMFPHHISPKEIPEDGAASLYRLSFPRPGAEKIMQPAQILRQQEGAAGGNEAQRFRISRVFYAICVLPPTSAHASPRRRSRRPGMHVEHVTCVREHAALRAGQGGFFFLLSIHRSYVRLQSCEAGSIWRDHQAPAQVPLLLDQFARTRSTV